MRLYKPRYKDRKTGEYRDSKKWYLAFTDHRDLVHRAAGFEDRRATEELGRNIERLVVCRASGLTPSIALVRWLEGAPRHVVDTLADSGVIDSSCAASHRPLVDQVDDFATAASMRNRTNKRVRELTTQVKRIIHGCGFRFWSDINAGKVEAFLSDQRQSRANFSVQTSNKHLQAFKQFCRWMVREGRATVSPVTSLERGNVETDRRRVRRALSLAELSRFLRAAAAGPVVFNMTGEERALLYRLALETGLRANELHSLTRASFNLDAIPPTVTVEATNSKRRRQDVLPLRAGTARLLADHLAKKLPAAQAFPMAKSDKTATMIRVDLEAAGIPYTDESGRVVDFHALRHTFITNLRDSGVHPRIAQALARHSDINLTMGRYTHVSLESEVAAVESLPDIDKSEVKPSKHASA